jgi:hypothetical protein
MSETVLPNTYHHFCPFVTYIALVKYAEPNEL